MSFAFVWSSNTIVLEDFLALCQVLGCDSLNHAPLLDLELFLYLIYFTMILGMANKPSSAHLKIN